MKTVNIKATIPETRKSTKMETRKMLIIKTRALTRTRAAMAYLILPASSKRFF
jgi:hypothetical protein